MNRINIVSTTSLTLDDTSLPIEDAPTLSNEDSSELEPSLDQMIRLSLDEWMRQGLDDDPIWSTHGPATATSNANGGALSPPPKPSDSNTTIQSMGERHSLTESTTDAAIATAAKEEKPKRRKGHQTPVFKKLFVGDPHSRPKQASFVIKKSQSMDESGNYRPNGDEKKSEKPQPPPKIEPSLGKWKTLIFIRHGKSKWNAAESSTFGKTVAVAQGFWELYRHRAALNKKTANRPPSNTTTIMDAPLSREGILEALRLQSFLRQSALTSYIQQYSQCIQQLAIQSQTKFRQSTEMNGTTTTTTTTTTTAGGTDGGNDGGGDTTVNQYIADFDLLTANTPKAATMTATTTDAVNDVSAAIDSVIDIDKRIAEEFQSLRLPIRFNDVPIKPQPTDPPPNRALLLDECLSILNGMGEIGSNSCVVTSNLRRAISTAVIGLWDRLQRHKKEQITVLSCLQEVGLNADTRSTVSKEGTPMVSRHEHSNSVFSPEMNISAAYANRLDMSYYNGDASDQTSEQRHREFCQWIFEDTDCEHIIAVGHSHWFLSFFRTLLPTQVSGDQLPHNVKQCKLKNCAVAICRIMQSHDYQPTKYNGCPWVIDPDSFTFIEAHPTERKASAVDSNAHSAATNIAQQSKSTTPNKVSKEVMTATHTDVPLQKGRLHSKTDPLGGRQPIIPTAATEQTIPPPPVPRLPPPPVPTFQLSTPQRGSTGVPLSLNEGDVDIDGVDILNSNHSSAGVTPISLSNDLPTAPTISNMNPNGAIAIEPMPPSQTTTSSKRKSSGLRGAFASSLSVISRTHDRLMASRSMPDLKQALTSRSRKGSDASADNSNANLAVLPDEPIQTQPHPVSVPNNEPQ